MKIKSLDRKVVKEIRNEINLALLKVTKKYGVNFTLGTIRFDSGEMRGKLTGTVPAIVEKKKQVKKDNAPNEWRIQAPFFGFKGDEYGKTFYGRNKELRVVGLNRKAKRYPVKLVDVKTGKTFKAPVDYVLRGLYGTTISQNGRGR